MTSAPALIADIGGTNARFALCEPGGGWHDVRRMKVIDYPDLAAAATAYLKQVRPAVAPNRGAFCVAGPVDGDRIRMTNHPWVISVDETRDRLGLERLDALNDFAAVALSIPRLAPTDVSKLGEGLAIGAAPVAVLGPGTGLGVATLVPDRDGGWIPVPGEGGHVTMAASTDREGQVLRWLRGSHNHVSAERVCSGQGLVNLYRAIATLEGSKPDDLAPVEVSGRARRGEDRHCAEALIMFAALLGTVAANLALTVGARGGVYLAGGILPRLGEDFPRETFRNRFQAKGRLSGYMNAIPTFLVTHEHPAFLGLSYRLEQ